MFGFGKKKRDRIAREEAQRLASERRPAPRVSEDWRRTAAPVETDSVIDAISSYPYGADDSDKGSHHSHGGHGGSYDGGSHHSSTTHHIPSHDTGSSHSSGSHYSGGHDSGSSYSGSDGGGGGGFDGGGSF